MLTLFFSLSWKGHNKLMDMDTSVLKALRGEKNKKNCRWVLLLRGPNEHRL